MGVASFQKETNVSRETMSRLERYVALLEKWNPAINLVARSTLPDIWSRHMLDSAQVFDIAPKGVRHWVDLGSGGGFPGLVVAALAKERAPDLHVSLVESDQRKAAFLRTVVREIDANASVVNSRIEALKNQQWEVISARALAALPQLLDWSAPLLAPEGRCLFMKGAMVEKELQEALASRAFVVEKFTSLTDSAASILSIGDIQRV